MSDNRKEDQNVGESVAPVVPVVEISNGRAERRFPSQSLHDEEYRSVNF